MIKIKRAQIQKFASFADANLIYIQNHSKTNGIVTFDYVVPILVNQTIIKQAQGDLIVRAYLSKKRNTAVTVKKSDVFSTNIFKKVDQQRVSQIASQKHIKKFFYEKYIERPDLEKKQIEFELEISESKVQDTFVLEIALMRIDGSSTTIDSIEINHLQVLQKYDLPSDSFYLSTTRDFSNNIYVSAATNDPVVGSFKFLIRKDSSTSFSANQFEKSTEVSVNYESNATAVFSSYDNDQSYTVRAYPVSKFLNQKIGNYKESRLQYVENIKKIPFYLSTLDDSSVSFRVTGIDKNIKKILVFRENLISGKREYVTSSDGLVGKSFSLYDYGRIFQFPYIYTCEYIDQTGEQIQSPAFVIVPALKLDKLATISVTRDKSTGTDSKSTNVLPSSQFKFNVEVSYNVDSLYDQIVEDVKSLGIESLFSSDLEKMTNNLKPITRVLVSKISLETGEETSIGVYQPGTITIQNSGISESCIYRFEVAVRSVPESLEMLTSGQEVLSNHAANLKSNVDLISKLIGNRSKTLSSNFSAKFLTKNSLLNSTLKYGNSLSLEDLSYYSGRTGIFADSRIDVTDVTGIQIRNIKILKTKKGNYITWNTSGNLSKILQFNITADERSYTCHPVEGSKQTFYIGNFQPKNITINFSRYTENVGNV